MCQIWQGQIFSLAVCFQASDVGVIGNAITLLHSVAKGSYNKAIKRTKRALATDCTKCESFSTD